MRVGAHTRESKVTPSLFSPQTDEWTSWLCVSALLRFVLPRLSVTNLSTPTYHISRDQIADATSLAINRSQGYDGLVVG